LYTGIYTDMYALYALYAQKKIFGIIVHTMHLMHASILFSIFYLRRKSLKRIRQENTT